MSDLWWKGSDPTTCQGYSGKGVEIISSQLTQTCLLYSTQDLTIDLIWLDMAGHHIAVLALNCTAPDFFGTGTIPEHHGVGVSTLEIIPSDSIFLSSVLTASLSWSGTFLAVYKACGLESGLSSMV